jgi:hypothetical protein
MKPVTARSRATKQSYINSWLAGIERRDCLAGIWGSYLEGGDLGNRIAPNDDAFANA